MRYQPALPATLAGSHAARAFFADCFAGLTSEALWVAHLDNNTRCIHLSHHPGAEAMVELPIRQIIADAVRYGSTGIVLAHNHPSGDARPSASDRAATRRLACAAEAIDLTLLDHLVFAGSECSSFRRLGLL
ncbi:DNA repair protein [Sphingomonas ginkgonis]|uniref:DNA repair protein n=1 Tax=Sphingomonas ginkgonis TaxID=2315330 RepID=A0A3R9WRZ8_9SPHN|nr:JAB domain-containing protein [Sphingomonas ginkgonis]RST31913.1 DNA repair protein [Sphingomonas ginkgonis]